MSACEVPVYRRPRPACRIGLAGIRLYAIRERFRIDPFIGEQPACENLPFCRATRALRPGTGIGDAEIADCARPNRGKREGVVESAGGDHIRCSDIQEVAGPPSHQE